MNGDDLVYIHYAFQLVFDAIVCSLQLLVHIYIYMYIYNMYIYIYTEREMQFISPRSFILSIVIELDPRL